jgi:plasmid stabilization system protein ParE
MRFFNDPATEKELHDAVAYYEQQQLGLGDRFLDEFERVANLLTEHPELGARVGLNVRFFMLDRFPFRLVYAVEDSGIRIIAVAHQKRRPDYWRGRVEDPRPTYAILRQAA